MLNADDVVRTLAALLRVVTNAPPPEDTRVVRDEWASRAEARADAAEEQMREFFLSVRVYIETRRGA